MSSKRKAFGSFDLTRKCFRNHRSVFISHCYTNFIPLRLSLLKSFIRIAGIPGLLTCEFKVGHERSTPEKFQKETTHVRLPREHAVDADRKACPCFLLLS